LERPESGAAIVEMAILLPILIMLVMGIVELGGAFKSYLTTSNAVRDGTRILSARGTDETGDCIAVVKAAEALTLGNDLSRLDRIEIFQASPSTGDPIAGTINTYSNPSGDPTLCDSTPPNCGSWTCSIQQDYSERNALVGADVSPDLIGMRIVYTHDWLTGIPPWTGSITIDEQTISRLEPEGFA
jgi:Flp pilus assembly protein TadG